MKFTLFQIALNNRQPQQYDIYAEGNFTLPTPKQIPTFSVNACIYTAVINSERFV
jgi:hypothetical protein